MAGNSLLVGSWSFKVTNFSGTLGDLLRLVKEKKRDLVSIDLNEVVNKFITELDSLTDLTAKVELISENIIPLVEILVMKSKGLNLIDIAETKRRILKAVLNPEKLFSLQAEGREIIKSFNEHNERILAERPPASKGDDLSRVPSRRKNGIDSLVRAVRRVLVNLQRPKQTIKIKAIHFDIAKRMASLRKLLITEGFVIVPKEVPQNTLIRDFLTLLELARSEEIFLEQDEEFGPIRAWKRG